MSVTRARTAAVAGATATGAIVWTLAQLLPGGGPDVPMGGDIVALGLGAVIATGIVAGLAGWISLALLERTVAKPRTWWTRLAGTVLAVSLLPLASPGLGATDQAWLALLHLSVGGVLMVMLRSTTRPDRSSVSQEVSVDVGAS